MKMLPLLVRIAWRNARQGGRRARLLAIAMGLVTALLVLTAALSGGLQTTMIDSVSAVLSGHVNVSGFYKISRGQASAVVTELPKIRAVVERSTPGLVSVVDRQRGWARIVGDAGSIKVILSGVDIDAETRLKSALRVRRQDGGDLDRLREGHTIALFESQARRLGAQPGDVVTIIGETRGGATNTVDAQVVAVTRDLGQISAWAAFGPKKMVRDLYQYRADTAGGLLLYLEDPDDAAVAMEALRVGLEEAGFAVLEHENQPFYFKRSRVAAEDWVGQKLDLTTWRDEMRALLWILAGFRAIRWTLLSLLLVIVGIGLMNTMWMTLRERSGEVGTLRAIGMPARMVWISFMLEAMMIGLIASVIGGAIGAGLAVGIDAMEVPVPMKAFQLIMMTDRIRLVTSIWDVAVAVLFVTGISALAAIPPARRAARLKPVVAMGRNLG